MPPTPDSRAPQELRDLVAARATRAGDRLVLSLADEKELAEELGTSRLAVQISAVEGQVLPARYLRSFGTLGWDGQLRLLRSRALVVGAGGLGGYLVEGLARMGVGRLHVVDGDVFQEHNLNRQLYCSEDSLGRPKAEVAVERARAANGAVQVTSHDCFFDESNADSLLADADVAVDALDSIHARLLLQEAAARRGVPMVHGAIAGFYAQAMTVLPGDLGLFRFYRRDGGRDRGIEQALGNPAATPMLCAALEVHEVVKLLTGIGTPLRERLMTVDSRDGYADTQDLG